MGADGRGKVSGNYVVGRTCRVPLRNPRMCHIREPASRKVHSNHRYSESHYCVQLNKEMLVPFLHPPPSPDILKVLESLNQIWDSIFVLACSKLWKVKVNRKLLLVERDSTQHWRKDKTISYYVNTDLETFMLQPQLRCHFPGMFIL